MRRPWRQWGLWLGVLVGSGVLHYIFSRFIGMPAATLIVLAIVVTWLVPHPWRILAPLSLVAEILAITPPLALTGAIWAPLLFFWLRGRIQADISFSYAVLVAVSAALSLGLVVGAAIYPNWLDPWSQVLLCWLIISFSAYAGSLLIISARGRWLHGRYF